MRMRDIQIVLAVADTGSFTKAADQLHLSQPAISLAVKRLEDNLGAKLFERHRSSVTISPRGRRAINSLRRMQEIFQSSISIDGRLRRLRIGVSSLLGGCDMSRLLQRISGFGSHMAEFEFNTSDNLRGRNDLDVAVCTSEFTTGAETTVDLEAVWIGVDNGVFIYSKKEHAMWDAARQALRASPHADVRVLEVSDCVYAYQFAARGIGMTPCVRARLSDFDSKVLDGLPELPRVRFAICAEERWITQVVERTLRVSAGRVAGPPV